MAECFFINYKGKEILYVDYQGLDTDKIIETIKLGNKMVMEYKNNEILILVNYRNTFATQEIFKELHSAESKEARKKIKKDAILGLIGLKKIYLNTYNKIMGSGDKMKAFYTEEEAKEWLIK